MRWKSLAVIAAPCVALLGLGCQADVGNEAEFSAKEQHVWFGTDAEKGSFPWIAQISVADTSNVYHHNCGGSLVAPNWILTAAHCVYASGTQDLIANSRYQITLGEHNKGADQEDGDEQVARQDLPRTVAQVIPHPDFFTAAGNDVALIRVSQPFQLNDKVQLVRLAQDDDGPNPDSKFAGWGYALGGDPLTQYEPDILQTATLPVVEDSVCDAFFQQFASPTYHDLTAGELCAGYNGTPNTCNMDSGGPLTVVRATGCEEQVGLLNWGYLGCGGYSVYARVSHHLDWIKQNVTNLGGDSTYQAETMTHSTGTTHPDGWNIYDNGYAAFNHTFTGGATTLVIRAAGKEGQGWPNMRVTVGNQEVLNIPVTTADWEEYPVTFNAPTGNLQVRVYFTNDLYLPNNNPPVDRNLLLENVVVEGKTACTAQDDAVSATLDVYDDWGTGYCARVQVTNAGSSPTTSWNVVVNAGNSTVFNSWNPPNKSGSGTHTFSSVSWNAAIAPNATYNQSGFCANRAPGTSTLPIVQDVSATF